MDERKFHCLIVGVDGSATIDEIRNAYLASAKILHPDKHQNSELAKQKFQQLNESYNWLTANMIHKPTAEDMVASRNESIENVIIELRSYESIMAVQKFLLTYTDLFRWPEPDLNEIAKIAKCAVNTKEFATVLYNAIQGEFQAGKKKQSLLMKFAFAVETDKVNNSKKELFATIMEKIFGGTELLSEGLVILDSVSPIEKMALISLAKKLGKATKQKTQIFLDEVKHGKIKTEASDYFLREHLKLFFEASERRAS